MVWLPHTANTAQLLVKPLIIVEPKGGLCNRMRAIVGALEFAKMLNGKMFVVWLKTSSLNANFSDLFQSIPSPVYSLSPRSRLYRLGRHVLKTTIPHVHVDDIFIQKNCRPDLHFCVSTLRGQNIFLQTCGNIANASGYEIFQLRSSLALRNPFKTMPPNVIAIHIRRTDNQTAKNHSPTNLFVNAMRRELEKNPDTRFYLATDDPKEEQALKQIFKGQIMTYRKRTLDRNSPAGIEDAAIDLFNLSACTKIYGSHYSSFSEVAAELGQIQKLTIKKT